MYYSPAMNEIKDFTDLAAAFTGDIKHGFISRVEGSGMEKAGICSGDYLLFTLDREPENGDIVFLEVYGQSMCRRVFFEQLLPEKKSCIRIRKEDGNTPDLMADERDVRINGVFEGGIYLVLQDGLTAEMVTPNEIMIKGAKIQVNFEDADSPARQRTYIPADIESIHAEAAALQHLLYEKGYVSEDVSVPNCRVSQTKPPMEEKTL